HLPARHDPSRVRAECIASLPADTDPGLSCRGYLPDLLRRSYSARRKVRASCARPEVYRGAVRTSSSAYSVFPGSPEVSVSTPAAIPVRVSLSRLFGGAEHAPIRSESGGRNQQKQAGRTGGSHCLPLHHVFHPHRLLPDAGGEDGGAARDAADQVQHTRRKAVVPRRDHVVASREYVRDEQPRKESE